MKNTTGQLQLENMEFYAYHGVLPEEQKIGAYYYVSLSLEFDATAAIRTDNLEHTIDYSKVYEVTKAEMAIPSKLIEHVAGRIGSKLLELFNEIIKLKVSVKKMSPPVNGNLPSSCIMLNFERE